MSEIIDLAEKVKAQQEEIERLRKALERIRTLDSISRANKLAADAIAAQPEKP